MRRRRSETYNFANPLTVFTGPPSMPPADDHIPCRQSLENDGLSRKWRVSNRIESDPEGGSTRRQPHQLPLLGCGVYRQPLPLAVNANIGEDARRIFMKVNEGPGLPVENTRPPFCQALHFTKGLQHGPDRCQRSFTRMLHFVAPLRMRIPPVRCFAHPYLRRTTKILAAGNRA